MVRSQAFSIHQIIGHPVTHVQRMTQWDVDELVILDISPNPNSYDIQREDQKWNGSKDLLDFISLIASTCAMPLSFGGTVRSLDHVGERIANGADKVVINSAMAENEALITQSAETFGSQAIIVSIDYRIVDGRARVFTHHAAIDQGVSPMEWARRAERLGAGEILLNAIDRDGTAQGYDIDIIAAVSDAVQIPVIACGGAGHQSHFRKVFDSTSASAVAAGNIFHFTENAYPRAKTYLRQHRNDIR